MSKFKLHRMGEGQYMYISNRVIFKIQKVSYNLWAAYELTRTGKRRSEHVYTARTLTLLKNLITNRLR